MDDMLVVTANDVPGYKIDETYGEVFGLIVRSRDVVSNLFAGLRTIFGGEIKEYTTLLSDSREHALARLREAAAAKGANAVVAMRFDSGDIGGTMNEVAAYGTAVKISKV
ncbi:MAG TPA: heavy metal-binding domain-containing protein [Candidatus Saccharimonadales bacterium]|nr:heavy metal-binding domain-containing protein [Candidatus Saccharimonadales bacterium]